MSLVSRDVPPFSVSGGVPARIIKYRRSPLDVAWDEGRYEGAGPANIYEEFGQADHAGSR